MWQTANFFTTKGIRLFCLKTPQTLFTSRFAGGFYVPKHILTKEKEREFTDNKRGAERSKAKINKYAYIMDIYSFVAAWSCSK